MYLVRGDGDGNLQAGGAIQRGMSVSVTQQLNTIAGSNRSAPAASMRLVQRSV
jgi:hypothetical protein